MRGMLVVASLTAVAWLSGCGENCQSTCEHVYSTDECGIVLPGVSADELIGSCVTQCERALQVTGEKRFEPREVPGTDDQWNLQNEAEASAWIDCVWEMAPDPGPSKACANIDPKQGGVCAPI